MPSLTFRAIAFLVVISLCHFQNYIVSASIGDRLEYYNTCLTNCKLTNCSNNTDTATATATASAASVTTQPVYLRFLGWSCEEECKYQCQWGTIEFLMSPDVNISWKNIPQFYGKWTFRRILGVQEPASALFSLMNLLSTIIAWSKYHKKIGNLVSMSKKRKILSKKHKKTTSNDSLDNLLGESDFSSVNDESIVSFDSPSTSSSLSNGSFNHYTTKLINGSGHMKGIITKERKKSTIFPKVTSNFPKIRYYIIKNYSRLCQFVFIDQFYFVNSLSALLGANAWIWSTVFHTHDYPLTEKLDYFSAFALVLFNLFAIILRILNDFYFTKYNQHNQCNGELLNDQLNVNLVVNNGNNLQAKVNNGFSLFSPMPIITNNLIINKCKKVNKIELQHNQQQSISFTMKFITLLMPFISFYLYHINYLCNVSFDYGYNMKVNAVSGITSACLWIIWSTLRIFTSEKSNKNNLKFGIFCILYVNSCFLLELCDFPPIFYASFDPHSLWHLTTIPFPLLWFRFLAEEASTELQCKLECDDERKKHKVN